MGMQFIQAITLSSRFDLLYAFFFSSIIIQLISAFDSNKLRVMSVIDHDKREQYIPQNKEIANFDKYKEKK